LVARGQLGREFQKHFEKLGTLHIQDLILTSLIYLIEKDVFDLVESEKPSVILNCAAYNQGG
jgi:dTDP-4-dehydrorhamnose reductase